MSLLLDRDPLKMWFEEIDPKRWAPEEEVLEIQVLSFLNQERTQVRQLLMKCETTTDKSRVYLMGDFVGYGWITKRRKIGKIGNVFEEVADFTRKINTELVDGDVQEQLDSPNQELIINELIEMHENVQDIAELQSLDPVQ
ncbi:hypothetical protein TNCV_3851531 [Trichonephila clavipes]|nr:hypothetical protein TNCV_3851531 [Trichonephila clavipes]